MKRKTEIARLPISDRIVGLATALEGCALLSRAGLTAGDQVASGELILRYGITYLGKPNLSIVPDLVIADYGELLNGEEAWDFLMSRAHLYPRADVSGRRNDGAEDMPALKQLDFDYPYDVFVYRELGDPQPLAKLSALIDDGAGEWPARLLKHLPRYDSLDAWRSDV